MKGSGIFWTITIVLLAMGLLATAGWIVYVAGVLLVKVSVAVIGVAGGIIAAIANHTLQLEKDRASHALELNKDRAAAQHLAKQENYKELLSKIGDFARKQDVAAADALTSAHLASWAFGDMEVLVATNKFQKDPNDQTLTDLLRAVRKSLQSDVLPEKFSEWGYHTEVLFPEMETKSVGLRKSTS